MEASSPKLTLSILQKYYPIIVRLDTFLSNHLNITCPGHEKFRVIHEEKDPEGYVRLLQSTFIGSSILKRTSFEAKPPRLNIREVIMRAQERLFKERRTPNILTLGYRYNWYQDPNRPPVISYFLNTITTIFEQQPWSYLLSRIGDDAMTDLLSETSIFLGLPNGCFCQISGDSVLYATQQINPAHQLSLESETRTRTQSKRPLSAVIGVENGPRKRVKLDARAQNTPIAIGDVKQVSPVDITFTRIRLLYSRPNVVPNSKTILIGLPLRHVLNRMYPSFSMGTPAVPSPEKDAKDIRHLAKYVFSRQYSFTNPFVGENGKTSFRFQDYLDKELEIMKSGPCKTPKRLKEVLPLLSKLLRRHRRCRYALVLDRACPSKIKHKVHMDMDSSVLLELLSETSITIKTQKSGGNNSVGSAGHHTLQEKAKPKFIEFSCSHYEVYRYVVHITNQVIPKSFWGSEKNLKVVFKYLREFISSRRHETLNLHHVLQGFSTSDCDWLCPPGGRARQQVRVSVTDTAKRRQLLEDFIFWYFDSFVMPLLKTTFYITPSSALKNHILYFRHDDWSTLCTPLVERLTDKTFKRLTEVEANELLRRRKLGFSFVRLLPKETGVRPIVNLRRKKQMNNGKEASINQVLQTAFSILSYEKTHQRELLGASIFGFDDIYNRLKQFKSRLPRDSGGRLPKLYFVKVDVQACFDTIDQAKLLSIIRNIISEDVYVTQRYGQVTISQDKVRRTFSKKAWPEDDLPHFLHHATELAKFLRNTIFVDQVVYHPAQKQEILQLLQEHITDNIVKIGKDYYRQMIGIPQGSVLSSILCSFFYGDLEKGFSIFSEGPENVLLRLIDDYLYITTDPRKAHLFLEKMHRGHPEYGCFISDDKTLTNFNHKTIVANVVDPSQKTFPWCGLSINMRDLSITVDYARYRGSGIRNTLTVEKGRASGKSFTFKMLMLAKAKNHNLFTDGALNTEYVVYLNAYQNLLMTALKMCEYLHDWRVRKNINTRFLRNVIQQVVLYSFTSMCRQAQKKGLTLGDIDTGIRKEAVIWLGYQAFHYVLSKRQTKYRDIVQWLSVENVKSNRRNHCYKRKFQTLMKSGQAHIAEVLTD